MGTYKCICGMEFDSPNKFNGHKQGCKIHIVNKYGSLEEYYAIKNRNNDKGRKVKARNEERRIQQNIKWVAEEHKCEKCGKVMTEKFGAGRFCSRSCANGRPHSEESRDKISKAVSTTLATTLTIKKNNDQLHYEESPNLCVICGSTIPYYKRHNATCGIGCTRKLQSKRMLDNYRGGISHTTVRKRYKYGTYKNVHCDSSWELAFVMYLKDHNIEFVRNTSDCFSYYYKGKEHLFFPDFLIDGIYYEIKNYESSLTTAKIEAFPKDKVLEVLFYKQLKPYIDYAVKTYGKEYYKLYDKNHPSWMDHEQK